MPVPLKPKDLPAHLRKQLGISGGRSKYGNVKTTVGGITFHSKAEGKRYGELLLMEKAGQARAIELQPEYPCVVNGKKVCVYKADFAYERDGLVVVEDVKGVRTEGFVLKKKLVEALYPGVKIREVTV